MLLQQELLLQPVLLLLWFPLLFHPQLLQSLLLQFLLLQTSLSSLHPQQPFLILFQPLFVFLLLYLMLYQSVVFLLLPVQEPISSFLFQLLFHLNPDELSASDRLIRCVLIDCELFLLFGHLLLANV